MGMKQMPALQEPRAGHVLCQSSPGAGRSLLPLLWNLPVLQGELRWDLQVVPGVGEWLEPLANSWEWTLTLHLTKRSGPCRAEQGVCGHPGTLKEPENIKRPWTQNNHCNGYVDCKAVKAQRFLCLRSLKAVSSTVPLNY